MYSKVTQHTLSPLAQVSLSPSPTITVDEDNDVTFTCSGVTGRQVLQVNSNFTIIPTDRITLISQDKSGSQYQFTGLTREDNGTSLQCFSNAVMSNIVTIIVDCKWFLSVELSLHSVSLPPLLSLSLPSLSPSPLSLPPSSSPHLSLQFLLDSILTVLVIL